MEPWQPTAPPMHGDRIRSRTRSCLYGCSWFDITRYFSSSGLGAADHKTAAGQPGVGGQTTGSTWRSLAPAAAQLANGPRPSIAAKRRRDSRVCDVYQKRLRAASQKAAAQRCTCTTRNCCSALTSMRSHSHADHWHAQLPLSGMENRQRRHVESP